MKGSSSSLKRKRHDESPSSESPTIPPERVLFYVILSGKDKGTGRRALKRETDVQEDEFNEVLKVLEDRNLLKQIPKKGQKHYMAAEFEPKTGVMASIPCGVCPRLSSCTPDVIISPTTCAYYPTWLDF